MPQDLPHPGNADRGTILLVEDDPGVVALERRRLERAGYTTVIAPTPEEALRQLQQRPVDLILLDYRLPGEIDGLDLYAQVRSAGFDIPVILVTGFSSEATVIRALRAGVRDFVTKTVEYLDYLPDAVDHVLRQVRTERQLAESEARLASIIGSAIDAILVAGADHRITLFNAAAEEMFRCAAGQAVGRSLEDFLPPEVLAAADDERQQKGTPRLTADGRRVNGERFPAEASISRAEVGGRRFYTAVVRDVTERKRLEAQYLHIQKMESIGTLAAGVAHDFNNLLTIINGYSDILLNRVGPDDPSRALLDEIRKAGERSAALTRQLLTFSRKQVVAPRLLDLNVLVIDLEKMLRRMIGEDVRLTTVLGSGIGAVRADPSQVEQVILNLVVNARDAMPRGGRLTIETQNVELDKEYTRAHAAVRPGSYVLLAVSDTGSGMSQEVKARVFEPFFTTKPPGKGTGLGLAVVHGVVQQCGGHIEIYSEVGVGTAFKVYFPMLNHAGHSVVAHSDPRIIPRGGETVLLVEDENGVRALARHVLSHCGYSVLEAADGDEAIHVASGHQGRLDLLITDVVMPGRGGRELAERIQALHPESRVLYVSGYTDDAIVRHGVLHEEVAFLQKPFSPAALGRKVREVLDVRSESLKS